MRKLRLSAKFKGCKGNLREIHRKMRFHKTILLLIVAAGIHAGVQAQQPFTLQNAIDTALKNNFDIRISKNNLEIAKINNSFGMAGGLPYVTASAGDNLSNTNTSQQLRDGTDLNIENQGENSVNAAIDAGVILFNGFRVMAAKERLEMLQNLGEIQLNQQIQSTMADIMITYFDIVRQQNYLKTIQHSLEVSKQKLGIVNVRSKVGMADAVDLLQAQTDVNSAEQQLALQNLVIEQNKADLLQLIGAKKFFLIDVTDTIVVDSSLELASILNFLEKNPQLLSAEQQVLIDKQLVKEVSSQRYPSVKLNAGYNFFQSDWNKSDLRMNRIYGPVAGITLQVPVFNGFIYKNQRDIAKIQVDNSIIQQESLISSLTTQATQLYRSYSTTLNQIESQQQNFEMTRQLVDVVMKQFNHGQATILDVKAAQTSFENAAFLLANLKYSAKVAEIELKQLTYTLVF